MNLELFSENTIETQREQLAGQALILHGFAVEHEVALWDALQTVLRSAPFRHMLTPGGLKMSVAMTNCGALGWMSDRRGYRYGALDPLTGKNWPAMPAIFNRLATEAAATAGFTGFIPDACLINRYEAGTRLSLHQDKNEKDFTQPIVSVSLGIPAVFLFGGHQRKDKTIRIGLRHGDVVIWGGADRLRYHGVMPLKPDDHRLLGPQRINLTFRKAG